MELLAKHFDIALEIPNGIKKLRELVLSLAMQGKLVPQDPKDEPASELLRMVNLKRKQLIKVNKIRKQISFHAITAEDIPYEIPENWEWVRLNYLGEINPRNEAADEMEAGFVPMQLIFADYGAKHKFEVRTWSNIKKGYTHFADQDVALAKITPCFENGKSCIFQGLPNGIGAGTTELHIFRNTFNAIYPKFLLAYLKNPKYIQLGKSKMTGSAGQKRVPKDFFASTPFPLPPIAEQKRIVAKIDQLLALCDKLESERDESNRKKLIIHSAAITKLINSSDKTAFNKSWNFITKNFSELYSIPENVKELKKVILQLAMQGKLVPQDPKDLPATNLLKDIQVERKRLVKEGRLKMQESLLIIKQEEIPYQIPPTWEWVRLGTVAQHNSGKTLDSGRNKGTYRSYITTSNLYWGYFVLDNLRRMPIKDLEIEKYSARKGDLLICEGGEAGRAAVWNYSDEICFQNHIHRVRFFCNINPYFAYRFFEKINYTGEIDNYRKGVAISNMSAKALSSIIFPLPPITEQNRIVNKINRLMSLCEKLGKQLYNSNIKQEEIFKVVLAKL